MKRLFWMPRLQLRSRSRLRLLGVAALAMASLGALAAPAVYVLDPDHSFVHFEVTHFGTSTSRGRFGPVTGEITLDCALGSGEVGVRIASASVDTGLAIFDARLRRSDLLASIEFPEAFFVSRQFHFEAGSLTELRGEFTFRGISQPLTLRARLFACRTEADTEVCGGEFEGEIKRSDFGATFLLPLVGDRVRLRVQVEGRRKP